ncbi:MAG: hypothetical protein JNJ83_02655 [Verrucomicrobiaceae bacterium]|nr:hypothetical protein [Verrucomicrobiaceae bacterium]
MARGNRLENIFLDDDDRQIFLKTPGVNLVSGMPWLQNTYTRSFNVRHRALGAGQKQEMKWVELAGKTTNRKT